MIDKETFANGMGLLAGAFNKNVDAAVSRAYYLVLNPLLNDAEFKKAVHCCLTQETFWPSPAKLLEKVKMPDGVEALTKLEHVTRTMSKHGGHRFLSHETYHAEFDAPTKAALSEIGGLQAIANVSEDRWPSMQKKFAAAYAKAVTPQIEGPKEVAAEVRQLVAQTSRSLSLAGRDRAAGERE